MSRPSSIRTTVVALLVLSSAALAPHAAAASNHWNCNLNGADLDIVITGDQATVKRNGGDARVLPRREVRKGNFYTDGTVALRFLGDAPASINNPTWVQNGQSSGLEQCRELAG